MQLSTNPLDDLDEPELTYCFHRLSHVNEYLQCKVYGSTSEATIAIWLLHHHVPGGDLTNQDH